jgi:hypothetical protein
MGAHLIEQCRRHNVTLRVDDDGDIEVEFDQIKPPHDLIVQLRFYKADVIRCLRGERLEEPSLGATQPRVSVSGPDDNSGSEAFRLFGSRL